MGWESYLVKLNLLNCSTDSKRDKSNTQFVVYTDSYFSTSNFNQADEITIIVNYRIETIVRIIIGERNFARLNHTESPRKVIHKFDPSEIQVFINPRLCRKYYHLYHCLDILFTSKGGYRKKARINEQNGNIYVAASLKFII